jgi:hypothetical protein
MCELLFSWLALLFGAVGHSTVVSMMMYERAQHCTPNCKHCVRRETMFEIRGQAYRVLPLLQICVLGELVLTALGFLYQLLPLSAPHEPVDYYMVASVGFLAAMIACIEWWLLRKIKRE